MNNFGAYSQYYDLLYKDKDHKAESLYVRNLIKNYFNSATSIIELGCGSGAHAQYLSDLGFNIVGIELSPHMAEIAKQKKIKNFEVTIGNISTTQLDKKFDVALSLFHVISYLTDNNALLACFKNTYQHLNNNGLFIFDIWYSPAVYFLKPDVRIKRLENKEIEVLRISEPTINYNANVIEVNFESIIENRLTNQVDHIKECHPMRHFSIPEIELIALNTGFEIVKVEEFLSSKEPSENTWGVCFILRKK